MAAFFSELPIFSKVDNIFPDFAIFDAIYIADSRLTFRSTKFLRRDSCTYSVQLYGILEQNIPKNINFMIYCWNILFRYPVLQPCAKPLFRSPV